jgi:hypothetical protein
MAKKKAERPTTIDVEISSGETITVGLLDWKGYKTIKPAIIDLMAARAAEVFSDPLVLEGAGGAAAMAPLLAGLDAAMGEVTPQFVDACVEDKHSLGVVKRPVDWLKLREAAAKVNDLNEILELEGNALVAAITAVMSRLTGATDGGFQLNTTLPSPTDGLSQT